LAVFKGELFLGLAPALASPARTGAIIDAGVEAGGKLEFGGARSPLRAGVALPSQKLRAGNLFGQAHSQRGKAGSVSFWKETSPAKFGRAAGK